MPEDFAAFYQTVELRQGFGFEIHGEESPSFEGSGCWVELMFTCLTLLYCETKIVCKVEKAEARFRVDPKLDWTRMRLRN